jgi:hypothetical protein
LLENAQLQEPVGASSSGNALKALESGEFVEDGPAPEG